MKGTLTMNAKERKLLSILHQHAGKILTVMEAGEEDGLSERQFYRIKARCSIEGDAGLVHRARGPRSNRGYDPAIREEVLELHRRKYGDYGPTLFAERLEVNEGYVIDHETLRRWLHAVGQMHVTRKGPKHRKKRPRNPHIGSMVQLDGSDHDLCAPSGSWDRRSSMQEVPRQKDGSSARIARTRTGSSRSCASMGSRESRRRYRS